MNMLTHTSVPSAVVPPGVQGVHNCEGESANWDVLVPTRILLWTSKTSKIVVAFSEHPTMYAVVFDEVSFPPGGMYVQFVLTLTFPSESSMSRAVVIQNIR